MKASMEPILNVERLTVNYDKDPVLWDLSFCVPHGALVGVIGPNGAGKSTLLKTLLGLMKPITGTIDYQGKEIKDLTGKVAYVPQKESVDWDFPITVLELVIMGCYGELGLFKRPGKEQHQKAQDLLQQVEMGEFAERQIDELSGGQKQRVFFARALMQDAQIYFLDEPFSGVDKKTESLLFEQLKILQNQGKTILVVHHDLNTVRQYFSWVLMLNMSLVASGKTQEVFTDANLKKTYGKGFPILEQVAKLSKRTNEGMV